MSYQHWHSPVDDENLRCWIVGVTTKLVEEKRYADVAQLMLVINDFESLTRMMTSEVDVDAEEFMSISISGLASSLSQIKWHKGTTNQDVYMILQNFSDFVQLNKLKRMNSDRIKIIIKVDWYMKNLTANFANFTILI